MQRDDVEQGDAQLFWADCVYESDKNEKHRGQQNQENQVVVPFILPIFKFVVSIALVDKAFGKVIIQFLHGLNNRLWLVALLDSQLLVNIVF